VSTILVIEDDTDIRALVEAKLTQSGHDVHTENDGEAGLAAVRSLAPDLVILDWMLPRLTGLEVCVAMRADDDLTHIPVILLTARAQEADLERGFAAGADDYLTKPFSPRELATRVAVLLDRTSR
jgi:DNA-binding response OmpR family regulator